MEGALGLDRFVAAQARVWPAPLREIVSSAKTSHWMWFVFPQLRGLGRSETARFYGLADGAEARAYLGHPLLGPRLAEVARAMLAHAGTPAADILGPVDALKLRSCMTLFATLPMADPVFRDVLVAFCNGPCPHTLEILGLDALP